MKPLERLVAQQMQMQQQMMDFQQGIMKQLAEQNHRTVTAINSLASQIRVLHTLVANNGGTRYTDEEVMSDMGDQFATLQASLLWAQRNIRLLRTEVEIQKTLRKGALPGSKQPRPSESLPKSSPSKEVKVPETTPEEVRAELGQISKRVAAVEEASGAELEDVLSEQISKHAVSLNDRLRESKRFTDQVDVVSALPRTILRPKSQSLHRRSSFRVTGRQVPAPTMFDPLVDGGVVAGSLATKVDFDTLLDRRMMLVKDKWTTSRDLPILCCTWNCNAMKPKTNLEAWISSKGLADPSIVVVALQEVVSLSAQHVLIDKERRMKPWEEAILATINHSDSEYGLVLSKQMVGIAIFIFAKTELLQFITDKATATVGCGTGGAGNKGAVAARFQIFSTTMSFVSSHLAAHKENVKARNKDYARIMEKVRFSIKGGNTRLEDHDCLFWLGDLNYRLGFPSSDLAKVYQLIEQENWKVLLAQDQLNAARGADKAFVHFFEGEISFAPTFKYTPNTNDYATGDGKNRMPAWCDRILWRSVGGNPVRQRWYRREDKLKMSDHKPVAAYFDVSSRVTDPNKKAAVYSQIFEALSKAAAVNKLASPSLSSSSDLKSKSAKSIPAMSLSSSLKNM